MRKHVDLSKPAGDPDRETEIDEPVVGTPVPQRVTRHQFRQAVLADENIGTFNSFYNGQSAADKLRLDESRYLEKDGSLLQAWKIAMDLDDTEFDDFLLSAATYEE